MKRCPLLNLFFFLLLLIPVHGFSKLKTENYTAPIGTIYSGNNWASTSDFIPNGTASVSLSGGFINVSAASVYNWANTIYITGNQTKLEKWQFKARFKITAWAANSYGIGFGVKSANAVVKNDVFGFIQTTNSGTGNLYIVKGDQSVLAVSSTTISFALNDVIDVTARFDVSQFVFTATNVNSGSSSTVSFTYASNGSTAVVPNSGYFSMLELGGTHQVQQIDISSEELAGGQIVTVGDSKTIGYFANSFTGRYAAQLNNDYAPAIINAGGGDRVLHALARQAELERLAPQKFLLCIGSNDLRFGGTLADLQTNYGTLVNILQATGASVYHILIPEDYTKSGAVNQLAFRDWIAATYGSFYINAVWDSLANGNVLKGIYDSGDGIHLNQAANNKIYEALVASGKLAITTLPVTMYSFDAVIINHDKVALNWEMDPANQAGKYQIMRSSEGVSFHLLGEVPANTYGMYSYTDHDPLHGNNFYQLKMTENDGQITYSRIVKISRKPQRVKLKKITGQPQELMIEVESSRTIKSGWEIFDAAGKKLVSGQLLLEAGSNILRIPAISLQQGIYHFLIYDQQGERIGVFSFYK